jgi:hypothetical protein
MNDKTKTYRAVPDFDTGPYPTIRRRFSIRWQMLRSLPFCSVLIQIASMEAEIDDKLQSNSS